MKCFCSYCGGTGKVTCYDCNGKGELDGDIATMRLDRHQNNYEELVELQKDAQRVIKQAARLKELRPHRSESYGEQLRATLLNINEQAERVAEQKKTKKKLTLNKAVGSLSD